MDLEFWQSQFDVGGTDVSRRFDALSPEDVVRWLRARSVRVDGVAFDYDSWENRVYGLHTSLGHIVAKVFRPGRWSHAALMDEVTFLDDLRAASMCVADVVRPEDGEAVGHAEGMSYLLYRHLDSDSDPTEDPEVLEIDQVKAWGAEVGRLHQVGRLRDAPARPRFSPQTALQLCEVVVGHGFVPPDQVERYRDQCARIALLLEAHSGGTQLQRIHADMGVNNLLLTKGGPVVIDFDDFEVGPAVTDVIMATYGYRLAGHDPVPRAVDAASLAAHFAARQPALQAFLEGYRTVIPFDDAELKLMEPLHLLRGLYFDAWYGSRFHDPLFVRELTKEGFPSPAWWTNNLGSYDLRLERLERGE